MIDRMPIEDTDEALLARVAAHRDADALAALYDRHRSVAYGLALRVTASVPAAEDVLQEAFLGVWRLASGFDAARGSGRSWLLAVVHHRAIDAVRRRRLADPLPELDGVASPSSLIAPDIWPEVEGRLDAVAVRRALGRLPDAQREAIELAYWAGLTQTEIAERTGEPLGTVKGRLRLGLQALRGAFREDVDTGGSGASTSSPHRPGLAAEGRLAASAAEGPVEPTTRSSDRIAPWFGAWAALAIGILGKPARPARLKAGRSA